MIQLDVSKQLLEQMFCESFSNTWWRVVKGLPVGIVLVSVEYVQPDAVQNPMTVRLMFDDGKPGPATEGTVLYEGRFLQGGAP
jgi:hypothetical protein